MRLHGMKSAVEYYRIIDADYAFVGLKAVMASVVRDAVDSLRRDGLRVGAVALAGASPLKIEIADLLSQVKAIGVVESRTKGQIGAALMGLLRRASATPEWYAPGRVPRVYSAVLDTGRVSPRQACLIALAKAMHTYEPEHILLTADGPAKPVGRISRERVFAAVA
jgi:pyruvate/2-oxoacid:ferredoxin oxidoreductase alpha subunit